MTLSTFLIVFIRIISLSSIKKRLRVMGDEFIELKERCASLQQNDQTINSRMPRIEGVADKLAGEAEKITSIERHLDQFHQKITENHDQLTGLASKLKEYDTQLGEAGQMMGKQAAAFNQAVQRIDDLEVKFQNLQEIQSAFEQIRNQILHVFGATQAKRPSQNTLTTERKVFKEEALIPSEEKIPETEGLDWVDRYQQPPRAV
jgi:DNA repair ATPase RecN